MGTLVRRALRLFLIALGALTLVAALWHGPSIMAAALPNTPTTGALSRRELLVGLLALGVLAMAALGFDLRDWI